MGRYVVTCCNNGAEREAVCANRPALRPVVTFTTCYNRCVVNGFAFRAGGARRGFYKQSVVISCKPVTTHSQCCKGLEWEGSVANEQPTKIATRAAGTTTRRI